MIRRFFQGIGLWFRNRVTQTAVAIFRRPVTPGSGRLASLGAAMGTIHQRLTSAWARVQDGSILNLPVIRRYAAWFGKQADYVQWALIVVSLALALLFGVVAGRMGLPAPKVQQANAEVLPADLAGELYGWIGGQPGAPPIACGAFEMQAPCQMRLAAEAEKYLGSFDEYFHRLQGEPQKAVWTRAGDAFPKFDARSGLTFSFGLEGKSQGDAKTCKPTRILAMMPEGIIAGAWADQGDAKAKVKAFAHPCLRAPDWTASVRVDSATAKIWDERARAEGWRLEMYYRLADWQSAFRQGWDDDSLLRGDDLLVERQMRLWVDEVRLVIGDVVVQQWR